MAGKRKGKLYIGTSGFHYNHWKGSFYPSGLPKKGWLDYYLNFFKTLEINNSFYKLPPPETFDEWRKSVPDDFVFSVKANRFITHSKKLKDPVEPLKRFFDSCSWLHEKLGPILFQLPPGWKINTERFQMFLEKLPKEYRYSFEFRQDSWYNEKVYKLLNDHNASFCIYHLEHHLSPVKITAYYVYIRLHGPGAKYSGLYNNETLYSWAKRMNTWKEEGKDVYVYFDNDEKGYAAKNAIQLRKLTENIDIDEPQYE